MNIFRVYIQKVSQLLKVSRISRGRYFLYLAIVNLLALFGSIFDAIGITMLFPALFQSVSSENLFETVPFLRNLLDFNELSYAQGFAIVAMFFAFKILLDLATAFFNNRFVCDFVQKLRANFSSNIFLRPLLDIEQLRAGDMSNRITLNARDASSYIGMGFKLGNSVLQILGYLFILLFLSPTVFLGSILAGSVFFSCLRVLYNKIAYLGLKNNLARDDSSRHFVERLHQVRLVKIMGTEMDEMRELSKKYGIWSATLFRHSIFVAITQQFTSSLFFISTIVLAVFAAFNPRLIASFVFLLAPAFVIIQRIMSHLNEFNNAFVKIKTSEPAVDIIIEDFDMKYSNPADRNHNTVDRIEEVEFSNVSFSYNSKLMLERINLAVKKGEAVLIQGSSGCGKTTLANLLRRIIIPSSGRVLYDGHSHEQVAAESLREQIGYVSQEAFVFNGTVEENLLYGNRRKVSEQEMWEILELCGSKEFVRSLPEGLGSNIAEKGATLSGGQKQKLSMARVLLRHPSVVILDEITNNLDVESKKTIINAVRKIIPEKIVFIISHDPQIEFENVTKYEIKNGHLVKP